MSIDSVSAPRIAPGTRKQIGLRASALTWVLGQAVGTGPPNVFTTIARHRGVFRPWLRFAFSLMPGGTLPREDTELLIIRVAHLCDCQYELTHHERLGREAGLTEEQIAAAGNPAGVPGLSDRDRLLIEAATELHEDRVVSDPTWEKLRTLYSEEQLLELCLLIGHYEMLAMTLNSARVQPDPPLSGPPGLVGRSIAAIARRRANRGGKRAG